MHHHHRRRPHHHHHHRRHYHHQHRPCEYEEIFCQRNVMQEVSSKDLMHHHRFRLEHVDAIAYTASSSIKIHSLTLREAYESR